MNSHSSSTSFRWLAALAVAVFLPSALLAADPLVSNVQGQQRPGTKLVDITYDVTADTPTVSVTLRISSDGGATFDVPATTLSGAVGANVPVGTGKVITWNAGADWLGNYSTAMQYEITVDGVPEGFAYVAAGSLPSSSWAGAQAVDAFFIGKTEVTWAEFQTVRTWAVENGYDIGSVGAGTGPNRPATNINWWDALKWCNARSEKDGLTPVYKVGSEVYRYGYFWPAIFTVDTSANGYRLPKDKEWEFAARGGRQTNGHEYSGSNDLDAVAWYVSNSDLSTHDVATKQANELGLSDMSGNVWEWCFDGFDERDRVIRGGALGYLEYYCRVATRGQLSPDGSFSDLGFRLARSSAMVRVAGGILPSSSSLDAQVVASFSIGRNEVTWSEWQTVRTWAASNGYDIGSIGAGTGPNRPVTDVSWYHVVKWCNARSEKEGLIPVYRVGTDVYRTGDAVPTVDATANGYRLPSDKEWAFAARGGVQTNGYEYSGSNDINTVAWYSSNSGSSPQDVATKQANELGISDMSGNVFEWCFDDWDGSGGDRAYRGGGWFSDTSDCRLAFRGYYAPPRALGHIGFRVARTSPLAISIEVSADTRSWSLTPSATENGNLSGGGIFDFGTQATLTAMPSPGYVFTGWIGDASGTDNPLTITMDANKTIGATFEKDLSDADRDGLTAYDELVVHGTNPALADTDGDGLSDGYELGIGRFSIVSGSFTWQQARNDAKSKGGDLACFPTEDRWNRALQGLAANPFDEFTGLWIGASDAVVDGTWTWVNGEPFNFAPWGPTRPSSTVGNTLDFAEVSGGAGAEIGKWYDQSASNTRDGYLLETGYATSPTVADGDGDGLSDGQEVNLSGTNPKLPDTDGDGTNDAESDQDGDGLTNLAEITTYGTNPQETDTDGDGLSDSTELDHPGRYFSLIEGSFTHAQASADAATRRGRLASFPNASDFTRMAARARKTTQGYLWLGLSDAATEGTWLWTDGSTPTYARWLNGQPDGGAAENHAVLMENSNQWADAVAEFVAAGYLFERVGLDPLAADTDSDGLSDGAEINTHQTSPVLDDSDSDGLSDGAEINTHGSNPKLADTDSDGLSDFAEVVTHGSNPSVKDSDGDGFDDLFEINTGFNPTQQASTPDAASGIQTAVKFWFNAAQGVSYRIEASTDLQTWETIEAVVVGEGGRVTRFYDIENQPKRYFRVKRN